MNLKKEIVVCICLLIIGCFAKTDRIVGGIRASIYDYPHLVSFRNLQNIHFCSGSIISRLHILSAAHCFIEFNKYSNIRVFTGTDNSRSTFGQMHDIRYIVNHPEFTWNLTKKQNPHDITIVTLKYRLTFNEFQKKISLPSRDIFDENLAVVVGWGLQSNTDALLSGKLLRAPMVLITHTTCKQKTTVTVFPQQFCAFNQYGASTSDVDSGGSVTSNGELFGIISLNTKFNSTLPDVHTKVHAYLPFINLIVGDAINA